MQWRYLRKLCDVCNPYCDAGVSNEAEKEIAGSGVVEPLLRYFTFLVPLLVN